MFDFFIRHPPSCCIFNNENANNNYFWNSKNCSENSSWVMGINNKKNNEAKNLLNPGCSVVLYWAKFKLNIFFLAKNL